MEDIVCPNCGQVGNHKTELKTNQLTCYCGGCGKFIKNLPQSKPKMFWGKYKDHYIDEITDIGYLQWVRDNVKMSERYRNAVREKIANLKIS